MDSIKEEITAEMSRTKIDKRALYNLLMKMCEQMGEGGGGGPGPRGVPGPQGPQVRPDRGAARQGCGGGAEEGQCEEGGVDEEGVHYGGGLKSSSFSKSISCTTSYKNVMSAN